MDIIPSPQTLTDIVPAGRQPVQHKPLAEFILLALAACASESVNTRRAYTKSWGDFLAYLSNIWDLDPPLASEEKILRDDGKMTRTQWVYSGDTRIFNQISPSLRDGFIQTLIEQGLSRATRNQRKNAVNTLLAVAYRDGFLLDDLARRLDVSAYKKREKNNEKPVGRRLSPPEVRKLRGAIDLITVDQETKNMIDVTKGFRDRAILDVMLYAGLRRSEVASLTTGDFKQDGGRWWLVLTGKGDKTRRVKIHDVLYKSLAAWAGKAGLKIGEGDQALFYNMAKGDSLTENPLNSSVIGRIVAEYGHKAGLAPRTGTNRLSPHDCRRTCARNAFDNGANLEQVRLMLGHSDPKTTSRYIGALESDSDTATDYVRY